MSTAFAVETFFCSRCFRHVEPDGPTCERCGFAMRSEPRGIRREIERPSCEECECLCIERQRVIETMMRQNGMHG